MVKKLFISNREILLFFVILIWNITKFQFYLYVGFPEANTYSHYAEFFSAFMLIICFKDVVDTKRNGYVSYIAIGMMLSFLMSIIFWSASPYYELQAQGTSVGLLYVVVYFALRRWNVENRTLESVLLTLGIIYIFCWLYSLYMMPTMIFGFDRDNNYGELDRGFYRFFIPGNLTPFLLFYFEGKFLREKKKWCLVMTLAMFVVIILHVGRQMIVWTLIPAILMAFLYYRKHMFYLLFAVLFCYFALKYIASEIPAVSSMIELSENQSDDIENNIRVDAIKYFIDDYPHNPVTSIWGNGAPARYTDIYNIEHRARNYSYYMEDVGFFAMYCNYGLWGVIFTILLLWRVIKLKVEPKYDYLKYFIYYAYGVYIMSQGLTSSFFVVMMAYYVLEKSAAKRNDYIHDEYNCK